MLVTCFFSSRKQTTVGLLPHATRLSSDQLTLKPIQIAAQNITYESTKDLIGEGGVCLVYRAQYNKLGLVAVKRLKADVAHVSELYATCIQREARCLRNLLHSNIVQFIGIIWEPNFHAVVLEYNANGDLLNFINKYNLDPYLKAKLLYDVSKGINYLHWLPKQIIHNDIKAGNILISDSITAKITDFGMADWNSFTTELFHPQQQSKYPQYLQGATATHRSPEKWRNINERTTKCDVYSYGILIWETYSEKKPFANCTNEDIKCAVTEGQRPDADLLGSNTPAIMVDIMRHCWHQDPGKRWEMKQVVENLDNKLSRDEKAKSAINKALQRIPKLSKTETEITNCSKVLVENNIDSKQEVRKEF